ncbi:hypothetical protein GCM10011491_44490 [Brucella endophytica]|uniref:Uncharacterized protein n=2 Tax=Brucella endophytica TaxID=1963359 RepID=A0A916WLJ6_9HYPH|nr:hypothetical protein [Brucella endophytica]GGB11701.1 hypothetical protein GCM10011491_44490 [Brucella endophytica]
MRQLGFETVFTAQSPKGPGLRIDLKAAYEAAKLLDTVPDGSLKPALALFAAINKTAGPARPSASGPRQLFFSLSEPVASKGWRIAMLLNLVDNATFDNDGGPVSEIVQRVTVESDALAGRNWADIAGELDARKNEARKTMTEVLPPDYEVHEDLGRQWPADGREWMFKIRLHPARPLTTDEITRSRSLVESIDSLMAWTAFETEKTPYEILSSGVVPYPVEVIAEADTVGIELEMPPSGMALPAVLMEEAVSAVSGSKPRSWDIDIEEGW